MGGSTWELFDLSGRTCAVFGGYGHIGGEVAQVLRDLGGDVTIFDTEDIVAAAQARGDVLGRAIEVDLSSERSTNHAIASFLEIHGTIDVVVHTAALVGTSALEGYATEMSSQSGEAFRKALAVNLESVFWVAQAFRAAMERSDVASLLAISSQYGSVAPRPSMYAGLPMASPAAYSASKGGLEQLVRHLAAEYAPTIRVNAIAPGGIARGQSEVFVERYTEHVPMRRMGTERDLRGAVALLASPASAWTTGQILHVDGGWTIW